MQRFEKILSGGDLRSLGKSQSVISLIKDQNDFDELFAHLFHNDRLVVMRAADVIEKITIDKPEYLSKHKKEILELFNGAKNIELKWHLAVLIPRVSLTNGEFERAWDDLIKWAKEKTGSKLVRVAAVQGLFEMTKNRNDLKNKFSLILNELEKENIPSINARIRAIKRKITRQ